jgi:D-glycero-D-manno-heptose 1,7-bisphosphate phosphatase
MTRTEAGRPIGNILLDRDGTLIEDCHYLGDPARVALLPGVLPALQAFVDKGFRLYMVTNQSGIGRGFLSVEAYLQVQQRLLEMLGDQGVFFADTAFCPHAPQDGCACRKPRTGLWRELAAKHRLDPKRCLMIGDKMSDVRFGENASLRASILVLTGKGQETAKHNGWPHPESGIREIPAGDSPQRSIRLAARDLCAVAAWLQGGALA